MLDNPAPQSLHFDQTVESAQSFDAADKLYSWVDSYLRGPANNPAAADILASNNMSDGWSLELVRLDSLIRHNGPEGELFEGNPLACSEASSVWNNRTSSLREAIESGAEMPPLVVVQGESGELSIWDGAHRQVAFLQSDIAEHWAVVRRNSQNAFDASEIDLRNESF